MFVKVATKLHSVQYLGVVTILFSAGLYKSAFFTYRKLGNKKTRNKISEISEISEVSEFSICHFFIFFLNFFFLFYNFDLSLFHFLSYFFLFFTNVFSTSLFYICNYSSTSYFINIIMTISLTKQDFLYLCSYVLVYKMHSQQRIKNVFAK